MNNLYLILPASANIQELANQELISHTELSRLIKNFRKLIEKKMEKSGYLYIHQHELHRLDQVIVNEIDTIQRQINDQFNVNLFLDRKEATINVLSKYYGDSLGTDTLSNYAIHDDFFKISRVSELDFFAFFSNVLSTYKTLFEDIQRAPISVHEHLILIEGLLTVLSVHNNEDLTNQDITTHDLIKNNSISTQIKPMTVQELALFRWRVGHHAFLINTLYCDAYLQYAIQAINNSETWYDFLGKASKFIRYTTASMWYASSFSAEIYKQIVRPAMAAQPISTGFSGTYNAEYMRLNKTKNEFRNLIYAHYGAETEKWPEDVFVACSNFVEIDIQDGEAHTLIAACLTGTSASIYQRNLAIQYGQMKSTVSSTQILRQITKNRKWVDL